MWIPIIVKELPNSNLHEPRHDTCEEIMIAVLQFFTEPTVTHRKDHDILPPKL
jgi:hypothetical protein